MPRSRPKSRTTEQASTASARPSDALHSKTLITERCMQVNPSCSNFIYLNLEFSSPQSTLLVDSGAEISIFKINTINPTQEINITEKCRITGINDLHIETIGTSSTKIMLPNGTSIEHKFHIVDTNFQIPTDGILGRDYVNKISLFH